MASAASVVARRVLSRMHERRLIGEGCALALGCRPAHRRRRPGANTTRCPHPGACAGATCSTAPGSMPTWAGPRMRARVHDAVGQPAHAGTGRHDAGESTRTCTSDDGAGANVHQFPADRDDPGQPDRVLPTILFSDISAAGRTPDFEEHRVISTCCCKQRRRLRPRRCGAHLDRSLDRALSAAQGAVGDPAARPAAVPRADRAVACAGAVAGGLGKTNSVNGNFLAARRARTLWCNDRQIQRLGGVPRPVAAPSDQVDLELRALDCTECTCLRTYADQTRRR